MAKPYRAWAKPNDNRGKESLEAERRSVESRYEDVLRRAEYYTGA